MKILMSINGTISTDGFCDVEIVESTSNTKTSVSFKEHITVDELAEILKSKLPKIEKEKQ